MTNREYISAYELTVKEMFDAYKANRNTSAMMLNTPAHDLCAWLDEEFSPSPKCLVAAAEATSNAVEQDGVAYIEPRHLPMVRKFVNIADTMANDLKDTLIKIERGEEVEFSKGDRWMFAALAAALAAALKAG